MSERTPYLQSAISLRTLVQLEITDPHASGIEMAALARHPTLNAVLVSVPMPSLFGYILANPGIRKLILDGSELGKSHRFENHVFQTLRAHPALTHLSIKHANSPYLVSEIGFNAKITSLQLHLSREAAAQVCDLAKMPALRIVALRASEPGIVLRQHDIANLCTKPLRALELRNFNMDAAAVSAAMVAQANYLLIGGENIEFSSADIAALCANKAIATLVLIGRISPANAAKLAASPTLTTLCLGQATPQLAYALKASMQPVWIAAGKQPSQLTTSLFLPNYDQAFI